MSGRSTAAVHVIVKGRVQGVGFRYFTQAAAHRQGIKGWVRNVANGDVEARATGPRPVLEVWLEELRKGPPLSRVDQLDVNWDEQPGDFLGFEIR
jgi:acylphosphatase